MGRCTYIYNPSEIYQRQKPGMGVETVCGALTFPAVDEPEIVPVRVPNPGSTEALYSYLHTGKMLPRAQDDPHCPAHGGSPEPPPPPVSLAELQAAHDAYLQLAARFDHAQADVPALEGVPLPAAPAEPLPADPSIGVPSAAELAAAGAALQALAERAAAQQTGVSGE